MGDRFWQRQRSTIRLRVTSDAHNQLCAYDIIDFDKKKKRKLWPLVILLGGDGSYGTPYSLNVNDMLLTTVTKDREIDATQV